MNEALIVVNGTTYRGDSAAHTVAPLDDTSALALSLLDTGELIGPQVDEWVGIRGTWDHYPASLIAAFMEVSDATPDLHVDWYSDTGQQAPAGG